MTDHLETLRQYQQWRRGADSEMLPSEVIGGAIDAVIAELIARRADGDSCGRQCEGTAYRIEARKQKHRADALAATIRALQDVVTHDAEAKADFIKRVRAVLAADPDERL